MQNTCRQIKEAVNSLCEAPHFFGSASDTCNEGHPLYFFDILIEFVSESDIDGLTQQEMKNSLMYCIKEDHYFERSKTGEFIPLRKEWEKYVNILRKAAQESAYNHKRVIYAYKIIDPSKVHPESQILEPHSKDSEFDQFFKATGLPESSLIN